MSRQGVSLLYSNKLGERAYSEIAPMLGLPVARQARNIRSKEKANQHFLPGLTNWAIEVAAGREYRPIQCGMDGTRTILKHSPVVLSDMLISHHMLNRIVMQRYVFFQHAP